MSRSDVLVDADWAEAHIGEPGVVIVEVDEDTSAYDKGHIPTAIKLDWKKDLQDPVRRDFVDKTGFETLLSERGISNDDTVLLYGGNNNWFAAYAYWYFKLYGHDKVLLLDGGRKKWELDSRELSTDVPERPRTSYTAKEQDSSLRAMRDEVIAAIGKRNLVDVRSPDEFTGRLLAPAHLPQEQAQRAGHVPTARNVPWSKAANEDGTFRSDDELRSLYARRGGPGLRPRHHRLLPDRRAVRAHLVRPARTARPAQRQELRRLVDRVRVPGRRADRTGGGTMSGANPASGASGANPASTASGANPASTASAGDGCGAPAGGVSVSAATGSQAVVEGRVVHEGSPVATGYARLLGTGDEFVAEVPLGDDGGFRFFAAPGSWTLRVLAPGGLRAERPVQADYGQVTKVDVSIWYPG